MSAAELRVVVIGGGAGGLELAARLGRRSRRDGLQVALVDRNPSHLWKPRLHEVAAGLHDAGDDSVSYLAQARAADFRFELGELLGIDTERRRVRLAKVVGPESGQELLGERELEYDRLVLAFGSRVSDFGVPGVLVHTHQLDSATQAARFQRSFFELAVQVAAGRQPQLRVTIVGAGATGVELAAELHHVVHELGRYGALDARDRLAITLVDRAPRVLASADPRTSAYALETLRRLGVEVRLGASVAEVTASAVRLADGAVVPSDIVVWASGVVGTEVAKALQGLELRKDGRIVVTPTLRCRGVAGVWAMGDCAAVPAGEGVLPPTAQVARQQAICLARVLRNLGDPAATPRRPRYSPIGRWARWCRSASARRLPSCLACFPAKKSCRHAALSPICYTSRSSTSTVRACTAGGERARWRWQTGSAAFLSRRSSCTDLS